MANAIETYNALRLYSALSDQLGNKSRVPFKGYSGRWPNHNRLVVKGNTYIIKEDDESITVRYHSTAIVNVSVNGEITLNSGGYRSYSTKTRMNEIARLGQDGYDSVFSVHQSNHEWFVNGDIPFHDGIVIMP